MAVARQVLVLPTDRFEVHRAGGADEASLVGTRGLTFTAAPLPDAPMIWAAVSDTSGTRMPLVWLAPWGPVGLRRLPPAEAHHRLTGHDRRPELPVIVARLDREGRGVAAAALLELALGRGLNRDVLLLLDEVEDRLGRQPDTEVPSARGRRDIPRTRVS